MFILYALICTYEISYVHTKISDVHMKTLYVASYIQKLHM